VLFSKKDLKYYYGYRENLKLRIEQHNKGKVESTRYRRPLELVYLRDACQKMMHLSGKSTLRLIMEECFLKID